ncbi:spliceosome RNA helicase DDX39B-like [Platysternon megacephalum]|uniref:Spliceosome RNA helicase DDX39B-like n=1 Tax=Platysternon megacephalum TaxID=55544 RepID=A0A4D9DL28_9SAUR|nr:spliceosome RNA helicase DDX39B-like [Platysternon megacephalum]
MARGFQSTIPKEMGPEPKKGSWPQSPCCLRRWKSRSRSWRRPMPGAALMLCCSVCWRKAMWTGSRWMRMPGRHPATRSARTPPPPRLGRDTYIIKLFDRSVDLAQFAESTPLYPICRAWMRNSPAVRERERSPSPPLPALPEDEEGAEGLNGKSQNVYKLPPPCAGLENAGGESVSARIPSPLPPENGGLPPDTTPDARPSMSSLIYKNMERWKKIRQRWKEASHRNQLRYTESMKILKEMYERQ